MINLVKHVKKTYSTQIILGMTGIPIGIIIGIIDAVFGQILLKITEIRQLYALYLLPFLPIAGIIIAYCYMHFGGKSNKGMNLVFEVGHGDEEIIPLRLIPFVISGTWLTHLFGGSAGREGVAVQIGATLSHWISRKIPLKNVSDIFLVVGMAAGFAGLFETPIAAVFFAMEVLVASELRYEALFPAITAAFAASTTSKMLGLEKFTFSLSNAVSLNGNMIVKLLILGIIFGFIGGMFAWSLKKAKQYASDLIKNPILRIAVAGICLSILFIFFYKGRYSGLGTNLIEASFNEGIIYQWDWLLKFILTVITLAVGFQGGEVTPLFSIGASLGVVMAALLGLPIEFAAAIGYVAMFGGATNTLFAPIFIGAEVFVFNHIPLLY